VDKKNYSLFLLIGCVSLLLYVFGGTLFPQVVSAFNKFSSQVFYYLQPKKGLSQDIVVVQIDDYSLSEVNKTWPFPRSFHARALDILREEGAKVVGLDIVFQGKGPSEEGDLLLKEALENLEGKAVLASYYNPKGILESSELFGDYATVAFVDAVPGRDGLVKGFRAFSQQEESFLRFSWVLEVASKYSGAVIQKQGENIVLGKQTIPLDQGEVTPVDYIPVNYVLMPKDFNTIPFYDLLQRDFPDNFFKGKIVLIGGTAEIIHDILDTPLGRIPGVFINANGIVNILEGKYLETTHPAFVLSVLLLSLAITAFIITSFSLLKGLMLCIGNLVVLFWLSLGLKFLGWDLSFGSLALPVLSFFILGTLYSYFRFMAVLAKIKSEMTVEPVTRLHKLRYLYERLNLDASSYPKKKRQVVIVALEGFKESIKGKNFEALKKLWKEINAVLFEAGELWAHCSQEALVGVTVQGLDLNRFRKGLEVILFEQEMSVRIKLGWFKLKGPLNIRRLVPFVVSELTKAKEEVVSFDSSQLPYQKPEKVQEADFATALYSDSETKNQELLEAIEKRIQEEGKRHEAYLQFVSSLVNALESKDPYTEGHSEKVCRYALLLADAAGISAEERGKIKTAALLHDLGKIGIPDKILHKKGQLTDEEFAFIKEHEVMSTKILEPLEEFKEVLPYILHHHENYDGSGYPHGLAGNFIPLGARIIAIADVYDALTTGRDYREALSVEKAIGILREMKGKRLDPELVETFLAIVEKEHKPRPKK